MRKMTFLTLLFAAGWLLAGCESDETAPSDPLPPLEAEDVASQSGVMAMILVEIAPFALEFSDKADAADGNYSYTFAPGDPVQGTVLLHFEREGAPSGYDVADYAMAWSVPDYPLALYPLDEGPAWLLAFTLESDIDQAGGTAVSSGSGTLEIGDYLAEWTATAIAVAEDDDWPASGVLIFANEGVTASVTFDGDSSAVVQVGGLTWSLDLNTGTLTEL